MLPQRALAIELQKAMQDIVVYSCQKKNDGFTIYQIPAYVENMKKFRAIDFLNMRGISFGDVKKHIDETLTHRIYTSIPRNLYMIDEDNIAFEDIIEWRVMMDLTLKKIIDILSGHPQVFYTSWY